MFMKRTSVRCCFLLNPFARISKDQNRTAAQNGHGVLHVCFEAGLSFFS